MYLFDTFQSLPCYLKSSTAIFLRSKVLMGQLLSVTPIGNLALILHQRYQVQLAALLPSSWRNKNAIESMWSYFIILLSRSIRGPL